VKTPIADVKSPLRASWRRIAEVSLILEVDALKGWKLSKPKYSLVYQLVNKNWKMNTVIDCLRQYFTSAPEH